MTAVTVTWSQIEISSGHFLVRCAPAVKKVNTAVIVAPNQHFFTIVNKVEYELSVKKVFSP
jgi:hypothetical protein